MRKIIPDNLGLTIGTILLGLLGIKIPRQEYRGPEERPEHIQEAMKAAAEAKRERRRKRNLRNLAWTQRYDHQR